MRKMMFNTMLLGLMMTAGDAAAAGVVTPEEALTLPDNTEGNRGPSNNNSSNNNGDPTMPITTPVPDDMSGDEGEITIGNSTNAVQDHARKYLTPLTETQLKISREVNGTYDIKPAFVEALGTTNVEPGPFNSAIRSNVYRYPEDHGQRACLVYQDGTMKFLASGTPYADWYAMSRDENVRCAAIVYFNQNKNADNPFVSVRWYKKSELPEIAEQDTSL